MGRVQHADDRNRARNAGLRFGRGRDRPSTTPRNLGCVESSNGKLPTLGPKRLQWTACSDCRRIRVQRGRKHPGHYEALRRQSHPRPYRSSPDGARVGAPLAAHRRLDVESARAHNDAPNAAIVR
jgi:hypothetical protein